MKSPMLLTILLSSVFVITACTKQESAPAAEELSSSEAAIQDSNISPAQQAAIDALDQPILNEKNQDVPASVVNAPAN